MEGTHFWAGRGSVKQCPAGQEANSEKCWENCASARGDPRAARPGALRRQFLHDASGETHVFGARRGARTELPSGPAAGERIWRGGARAACDQGAVFHVSGLAEKGAFHVEGMHFWAGRGSVKKCPAGPEANSEKCWENCASSRGDPRAARPGALRVQFFMMPRVKRTFLERGAMPGRSSQAALQQESAFGGEGGEAD